MNAIPPRTSVSAILSMVFGIISWAGFFFFGAVVAVILGHVARGEIRSAPPGTIDGDGMAVAGLVLGYLNLAFCLLVVLAMLLFFGGFAVLAALAS